MGPLNLPIPDHAANAGARVSSAVRPQATTPNLTHTFRNNLGSAERGRRDARRAQRRALLRLHTERRARGRRFYQMWWMRLPSVTRIELQAASVRPGAYLTDEQDEELSSGGFEAAEASN
ncbi:hypothetical protein F441_13393 [Phytophthora nicotianae CJ01A1]|uniref:Uncharacterized protein n=2 Tax=Phytophthora nicotianae TaxID=4792 RepID=W2WKZ3_PHYNI|nr:hypothetical protein L915_13143 [Phytophthora nicotianae]ETP11042.1 hypothetical protein F441_13393 [Phytophthora nicotianae CJ01A1]